MSDIVERIKRWWYGHEHDFQPTGVEYYEDSSPKLSMGGGKFVIERRHYEMTECEICGERGFPRVHDIDTKVLKELDE